MRARGLVWVGPVALLVLAARWLAYALAPASPLTTRFEASAGGPRLVVVAVVSLGLAAAVSAALVWLVAVGVRERQKLRPERELPRLRLFRLALRAVALAVVGSLGFALLESYVHWRAGLGFHGLSCLLGPVHRNVLPLLAALALLASALSEAVAHLHAWLRASVRALLRPRFALASPQVTLLSLRHRLFLGPRPPRAQPRAPPFPA